MKNNTKMGHRQKQTNMDTDKRYIKKIRFYPYFLYSRLDKWLKLMSLNGWHITHCGMFYFLFEKGKSGEKEYFTYGLSSQEGKYSISLRHPFLEQTYGLKESKINSNKTKAYNIIEIDTNRIDVKNDVGYKELISDRNRLYLRYFVRNSSFILAALAVLVILLCV